MIIKNGNKYSNKFLLFTAIEIMVTVAVPIKINRLYDDMKRTYHINIPKKLRESMEDNRFEK